MNSLTLKQAADFLKMHPEEVHRTLVSELRSHIDDLRREADQANAHSERMKRDLDEARTTADAAAIQFDRERAVSNSDLDRVATREMEAPETIITLRGQIAALTTQNADLLAKLRPTKSPAP